MAARTTPICVMDRIEMTCVKNGYVVEDAHEQRRGDAYACPMCDAYIVIGFADEPQAQSFEVTRWIARRAPDLVLAELP